MGNTANQFLPENASVPEIIDSVNSAIQGNLINTNLFTVAENTTTTTVKDSRISGNSVIAFMPTTANAATEIATLYVSDRKLGEFTVTHANNAQTDRTFEYAIFG